MSLLKNLTYKKTQNIPKDKEEQQKFLLNIIKEFVVNYTKAYHQVLEPNINYMSPIPDYIKSYIKQIYNDNASQLNLFRNFVCLAFAEEGINFKINNVSFEEKSDTYSYFSWIVVEKEKDESK